MGDAQLELVCDGSDPRIVLCFKHLFGTSQIQVACRQRHMYKDHTHCPGDETDHIRHCMGRGTEVTCTAALKELFSLKPSLNSSSVP